MLAFASVAVAQQFELLQQSPLDVSVPASWAGGIAADADGNGTVDVLLRSGSLLLGDGNLHFTYSPPGQRIPTQAFGFPTGFELVADVDGDGDLDLIRTTLEFVPLLQTTVRVLPGLPGGTWGPETAVGSVAGVGALCAVRDVDGDGHPDLFLRGGLPGGSFALLHNQGNGTFVDITATAVMGALGVPQGFADVDGDGDVDFVTGGAGPLRLFLNGGAGTFAPAAASGLPALGSVDVSAFGDADGDGDPDLLLGVANGQPMQLFVNAGNGTFAASAGVLPAFGAQLRFVDLDHDGRADVVSVVGGVAGPRLKVMRNLGGGAFQALAAVPFAGDLGNSQPELADLDADGDLDLVVAGQLFFVHDGQCGFAPLQQRSSAAASGATLVAADFDGDGFVDLAKGSEVLRNRGDGYQEARGVSLPAGGLVRAVCDADGDGDADLVWTSDPTVGSACGWLRNQQGTFVPQALPNGSLVGAVVAADFDGDGRVDLLSEAGGFLRNVAGGFVPVGGVLPIAAPLVAGDLDGDGATDLVAGSPSGWAVWRNLGSFAFQQLAQQQHYLDGAALGDLDADGDLDLAITWTSSGFGGTFGMVTVWNNAAGQLTAGFADFVGSFRPQGLVLADVDEDGAVDLVAHSVWINQGLGSAFVRRSDALGGSVSVAADLDADGDVDIAMDGGASALVFVNRHRHLAAPVAAVLGQPYRITMATRPGYGSGNELLLPSASFVRLAAPVQLPGLGLLQLDPGALIIGPVVAPAPDGTSKFAFPLPAIPALGGLPFGWQGLVLDAAGLRLTGCVQDILRR